MPFYRRVEGVIRLFEQRVQEMAVGHKFPPGNLIMNVLVYSMRMAKRLKVEKAATDDRPLLDSRARLSHKRAHIVMDRNMEKPKK